MISQIRIRGLGVIDDATLDLGPGLNVLTGETGAGKTMVVTGLGLLLGARADTAAVRTGARAAVVEGVVDVAPEHPAARRASEAGGDVEDGLVLVRTVPGQGSSSRAHVGGRVAPAGTLADIGQELVAVHGQADQWRLRRAAQHREVLDRFGGPDLAELAAAHAAAHADLVRVAGAIAELRASTRERAREAAALTAALEAIERVDPQDGEELALEQEIARLDHADALQGAAARAHEALAAEETGGAVALVSGAAEALQRAADHDPDLQDLATRAAEVGYLAADLSADLRSYADGLEADPVRLGHLQERVATLAPLLRAYGPTCADVLAYAARAAARLEEVGDSDDRLERLGARLAQARRTAGGTAVALSAARRAAALLLQERVQTELGHLAMGGTRVVVEVSGAADRDTGSTDDDTGDAGDAGAGAAAGASADGVLVELDDGRLVPATASGFDTVHLQLASGAGATPRSITRAASGGELSRVMLALELVCSEGEVPTFVFDEVDAGVGGAAALELGRRLAVLARTAQVIVVTHLPQVAALADRHLVVAKGTDPDGAVTSTVTTVDGGEREAELARMLAGSSRAPAALEHARQLLTEESRHRAHPASRGGR